MRFLLLFLLFYNIILSQNPQPYFRNYTTEHGLPSSEVYHGIQDSKGFIWFCTDNGISRFDGYEFQNFDINDGLPENVIFYIQEDAKGRIWMNTMSGKLCFLENDSVFLYKFNHLIEEEKERSKGVIFNVAQFYIQDETVYLKLENWGILKIDSIGNTKLFRGSNYNASVIFEVGDEVFWNGTDYPDSIQQKIIQALRKKSVYFLSFEIYENEKRTTLSFEYNKKPGWDGWANKLNDGSLLVNRLGYTYIIKGKNKLNEWINSGFKSENKAFLQTIEGLIYQGFINQEGIHVYKNIEDYHRNPFMTLLKGYSVSSIFQDRSKGFWVTTIDKGVFYCKDLKQKIYSSNIGITEDRIISIETKDDSTLFLALWDGNILEFNFLKNHFKALPKFNSSLFFGDLFYDSERDRLWAGKYNLFFLQNNSWVRVFENAIDSRQQYLDFPIANVISQSKKNRFVWTAGSKGFGKVDLVLKKPVFSSRRIGYENRSLTILESKSDRIWIGTTDGLLELREDTIIQQRGHPAFEYRVEALGELSDSTIVIGIKGKGIYFWNTYKKEPFLNVNKEDGLTSNLIENIHVDDKDQIWVGTPLGLNKIIISTKSKEGSPEVTIYNYTTNHGLPSNEINQVHTYKNHIWVGTSKGLLELIEPPVSKVSLKPIIQSISLKGEKVAPDTFVTIPYRNNSLTIKYVTLNYGQGGNNILYRFQISPGQNNEWSYTNNRSVNFSSLNAGEYLFQVQSQNEDGFWSQSATFPFRILAPFWQRWWFFLLLIILISGLFLVIYNFRIGQIKQEALVQKRMSELERSALRTQMNPHFIFNALNSIQNYINQGDKLTANRYLSRFARLIRTALNHSRVTKILLEDEINTLSNYLELEQMRFSSEFDYDITISDDLEPFNIELPSMLIQPFVENSIVHGLSAKEGKGKISIHFAKANNKLLVTIIDNGIGLNESLKLKKSSLHKSVGMTITKQRLELINGKAKSPYLEVKELKNKKGKVTGTSVKLEINL